jgi:hypothetical protein
VVTRCSCVLRLVEGTRVLVCRSRSTLSATVLSRWWSYIVPRWGINAQQRPSYCHNGFLAMKPRATLTSRTVRPCIASRS